jgi:hypothetical protein
LVAVMGALAVQAATSVVMIGRRQRRSAELARGEWVFGDGWEAGLGLAYLGLMGMALVTWLIWQRRAHANVAAFGGGHFTPRAIFWWLVPVASLFMPYRAVKELDQTAGSGPAWKRRLWWGSLIGGNYLGAMTISIPYSTPHQITIAESISLASDVAAMVAGLLAIAMVRRIDEGINEFRRRAGLFAGPAPLGGRSLLAWGGAATAAVVVAGVVLGAGLPAAVNPPGSTTTIAALAVGDCFADTAEGYPKVACTEDHAGEVFAVLEHPPAATYPGEERFTSWADPLCYVRFSSYTGVDYSDSSLDYSFLFPSAAGWLSGDREVICFLFDPAGNLSQPVRAGAAA